MERESREVGSRLRAVILTVLRCVFICMSTPATSVSRYAGEARKSVRTGDGAVDDGAVLELDGDRLIVEFHQKPGGR